MPKVMMKRLVMAQVDSLFHKSYCKPYITILEHLRISVIDKEKRLGMINTNRAIYEKCSFVKYNLVGNDPTHSFWSLKS